MRDKLKEQQNNKNNYQKHKTQRNLDSKEYYKNNIDAIKLKQKEYRKNNKESIYQRNRARRLKLKNVISQEMINNLLIKHNNKCYYCDIEVMRGINLHLDHIVPLSKGGVHDVTNLAPACQSCNLKKGTKTKEQFLASLENPNV